jgi:hypothetical protein
VGICFHLRYHPSALLPQPVQRQVAVPCPTAAGPLQRVRSLAYQTSRRVATSSARESKPPSSANIDAQPPPAVSPSQHHGSTAGISQHMMLSDALSCHLIACHHQQNFPGIWFQFFTKSPVLFYRLLSFREVAHEHLLTASRARAAPQQASTDTSYGPAACT